MAACAAPITTGRSTATGACAHIPSGDKIPSAARIFTYPSEEKWGLVWAFNGERADFPVPQIPDAEPDTIDYEAYERGERPWDTWVAVSNGVDFQHLQHPARHCPRRRCRRSCRSRRAAIAFRVESPYHLQAGRITGTNTFAQHLRMGGQDMFMLFSGAPIEPERSRGFFVVGVPKGQAERLP